MRYQFDDVTVDTDSRAVTIRDECVHLPPRLFATLQTLVEHYDRVVSRDELKAAVWPDTHVQSNSVAQAVKAVRRVLAAGSAADRIRTLPRQGYCFVGPVLVAERDEEVRKPPRQPVPQTLAPWAQMTVAACAVITALCVLSMALRETRVALSAESAALHREGVALLATRRAADLRRAAGRFAHAVALDARNYDALTALAQTQHLMGFYGIGGARQIARLAHGTANQAIQVDPDRAAAYAVRAAIALDAEWDLSTSADDFARAIRLEPHDPLTRHWAAWWCLAADRMPDARALLETAVRLDPFSPVVLTARATFAYLDGDLEAATADAERALTLDPDFFRAHLRLGLVQLVSGDVDRGLARIGLAQRLAPEIPETAAALAHAYAVSGQRGQARRMLAEDGGRLSSYDRAIVLTGLGLHGDALDALWAARHKRQLVPGLFAHEPRLEPLRRFPQFQSLRAAFARSGPELRVLLPVSMPFTTD